MNYLTFEKEQLINLEYSLNREILRSNRAGSYISTTLNGCNTRKYHGLLICPVHNFGGEKHVLLSSLDESILQNGSEFNLAIHRYQGGVYEPKGHKYLFRVEFDRIPGTVYRIGNFTLRKERLLVDKVEQLLIRYTLEDAQSDVVLRLKPFLAFRNIHQLSKANLFVNTKFRKAANGIILKLYEGYPDLYLQTSKSAEFIPVPDWYYHFEYTKELNRGYDFLEDLFIPGYFEFPLKKGESVVFSAGTLETNPVSLKQRFTRELKKRNGRLNFLSTLENAAEQFVVFEKDRTDIVAGFPWYNPITRQTFIALPGLSLALKQEEIFREILSTYKKYLKDGFFPDQVGEKVPVYHSADSSLWFIWAVQQYFKKYPSANEVWGEFGPEIKRILSAYKKSSKKYIGTTPDGLVYAEKENIPLTWMNGMVQGKPVTQRAGMPVEVNALWYNAVCFALELAGQAGDNDFTGEWEKWPETIAASFLKTFWHKGHDHPADVVRKGQADWSVRPNMVIAAALDYSPLSVDQRKSLLSVAKKKLLTNRGLRTLSPDHLRYKGVVEGGPDEREHAVHQGAVWPWLIQFFAEGYLKIHKRGGVPFIKQIMESFESEITEHCIGTMSEMYNGNPPHKAKGAISQAWSVAGVIYAIHLVRNYHE